MRTIASDRAERLEAILENQARVQSAAAAPATTVLLEALHEAIDGCQPCRDNATRTRLQVYRAVIGDLPIHELRPRGQEIVVRGLWDAQLEYERETSDFDHLRFVGHLVVTNHLQPS